MATYREGLFLIMESIRRGKGSFNLSESPEQGAARSFALSTGSSEHVDVPGGVIISIALSREQLEGLRDACDDLLKRGN